MAGSAIQLTAIAIVLVTILGQPILGDPITAAIEFTSVFEPTAGKVEINCKNSIKHTTIGKDGQQEPSCPVYSDYWMKHLVLVPEQQTALVFVPGHQFLENGDWCWSCDFDWGRNMVNALLIFPNHTELESPWTSEDLNSLSFQLRPTGIYQRITYGQNGEYEMYVLARKWEPKGDFKCTQAGRFRDPFECNKFHVCEAFGGGFVHNKFTCPQAATVYCEREDKCGYESECPC